MRTGTSNSSGEFFTYELLCATDACSRAEAVPDDICVGQTFKELNSQLVKDTVVAMHTWAEKPLKGTLQKYRDNLYSYCTVRVPRRPGKSFEDLSADFPPQP